MLESPAKEGAAWELIFTIMLIPRGVHCAKIAVAVRPSELGTLVLSFRH